MFLFFQSNCHVLKAFSSRSPSNEAFSRNLFRYTNRPNVNKVMSSNVIACAQWRHTAAAWRNKCVPASRNDDSRSSIVDFCCGIWIQIEWVFVSVWSDPFASGSNIHWDVEHRLMKITSARDDSFHESACSATRHRYMDNNRCSG